MTMTDTEKEELKRASRVHQRRRDAYEEAHADLAEKILAAHHAGIQQKEIAQITGYTREAIRQLCLSPEQREAEKEKRRERTRVKKTDAD